MDMDFIVVNVPSPYNAILGRAWIHAMEAVASTYHQVVRFIGASGRQEDVFGDQAASKKCYISAVKESREIKQVQWVEVPDAPVLEDVGASLDERVVEEVVKLPADDKGDHSFSLGSGQPQTRQDATYSFLRDNVEVFAWTPYEMPGVNPSFISHSLNVDPDRRPVVQRPRRSSPAHTQAVIEEVDRLLEAGAIREVQYPTWLANTVVVK